MRHLLIIPFLFFLSEISVQDWQITKISDDGIKPILAIDSEDRVHIVYMTESQIGWVRYASMENGNVEIDDVSSGYFYGPPDITYDENNNPVIAYHDHETEDQAVRKRVNGEWLNLDTPHPGHDGWDNAVLVDAFGNMHTSSVDPSSFGGLGIEYGFFDGTSWLVETVSSGPIMYANATSIHLGSENNVYISYYNDATEVLELASRINGTWQIETIDSNPGSGRFSSLYIDENNSIYISYHADGDFIKLASKVNGTWSFQTIDQLENLELGFSGARNVTSLGRHNDILGIAYGDKGAIKYASLILDGLNVESTDTVAAKSDQDFGQIVSLGFTSNGTAFISFSGSNGNENPLGNIFIAQKSFVSRTSNLIENDIYVFPNPVIAGHQLYSDFFKGKTVFQLYSLDGKLATRGRAFDGAISIPEHLLTGVYILSIHSEKNNITSNTKIEIVKN